MTPGPPPADGIEWGNIAQIWAAGISSLAFIVSMVAMFRQRNDKAIDEIKDDIEGLSTNVGELYQQDKKLNERMATVETEIKHLPTRDELHRIDTKITAIGATLEARFEALSRQLGTIIAQNERAQDRLAEREDRK